MPVTSRFPSRSRTRRVALVTAFACVAAGTSGPASVLANDIDLLAQASSAALASASLAAEPLIVTIDVNRERTEGTFVVQRSADDRYWIPLADLARLRLERPVGAPRRFDGVEHVALDSLPGTLLTFDRRALALTIIAPASAFTATERARRAASPRAPTEPSPGGFFNYSLFAAHAPGGTQTTAQIEAGVFDRHGVLTSGGLVGDAPDGGRRRAVRLDTTWTTDFPERLTTLRLGDTVSNPGRWGRAVRYGGAQFGTNFAIQPTFVTAPLAVAGGQAALPSTVDVFVNNALVARERVPAGPFSITNIPVVSGSGDVRLVVRDLFGQEQLLTMPFYGGSQLLMAGLDEWTVEGGTERIDFGTASDRYGRGFASATWRRGMTDTLTAEWRVEASRASQAAGIGLDALVGRLGTASAAVVASRREDARGGAYAQIGFEHQASAFSAAMRGQWATPDFALVGDTPDAPAPWRQWVAAAGAQFGRAGSLSATWIRQDFRDKPGLRVASASYAFPVFARSSVALVASRAWGEGGNLSIGVSLTVPFGIGDTASLVYNGVRKSATGDRDEGIATVQRSLPAGEGFGYRIAVHTEDEAQVGAAWQGRYGIVGAEVARFRGETAVRANVQGGLGYVGGVAFASRPIRESFAIARVADYAGVEVTVDHQSVGKTGADGTVVLPALRPYDANRVGLVASTIPLDAQVDRLSQDAIPAFRSGILVDLPVRRVRSATFRVRLDDGAWLPAGAIIRIEGRGEPFPVGLDGAAYVVGLSARDRLVAEWDGRRCAFELAWPGGADPLPDLGAVRCVGGLQ